MRKKLNKQHSLRNEKPFNKSVIIEIARFIRKLKLYTNSKKKTDVIRTTCFLFFPKFVKPIQRDNSKD